MNYTALASYANKTELSTYANMTLLSTYANLTTMYGALVGYANKTELSTYANMTLLSTYANQTFVNTNINNNMSLKFNVSGGNITGEVNMTSKNITDVDCIIFRTGGHWCSV